MIFTAIRWPLYAGLPALLLGGCASFSTDGGFGPIAERTQSQIGKDLVWSQSISDQEKIDQRVATLLSNQALGVEEAVQVALFNNRGLQANFAELGISEAELVQTGRLANPSFSMSRASSGTGAAREFAIEQSLTFNIISLLTLPQATAIEQRRFEQTQRMVTLDVLRLAYDTRKAYFTALAADESKRYAGQVLQSAEVGAELAQRMTKAGNWSKLQQAREQGFRADAILTAARAEQASVAAHERLARLMGLTTKQYQLPERLPDLPKTPDDLPNVEQSAMDERLDLQAIRLHTQALAKNLDLSQATRFINVLELGPTRALEGASDATYKTGYEISFELPLFDWGGAKVAKAQSIYMQALNQAAQAAINARSEVREAYRGYHASYNIARHYRDEIVPLKKRVSEENQLRYNGMFISVFELLADARSQITSVNASIEALRDFWLAKADLDMTMLGKPNQTSIGASAMSADAGDNQH